MLTQKDSSPEGLESTLRGLQDANDELRGQNEALKERVDALEKAEAGRRLADAEIALGDVGKRIAELEDKMPPGPGLDDDTLAKLEAIAGAIDPDAVRDTISKVDALPSDLAAIPARVAVLEAGGSPPPAQGDPATNAGPINDPRVDDLAATVPILQRRLDAMEEAAVKAQDALSGLAGAPDALAKAKEDLADALKRLSAVEAVAGDASQAAKVAKDVAQGASARAHDATVRCSDMEDQIIALRLAVEALDKGEKVELPPPIQTKERGPVVDPEAFDRLRDDVEKMAEEAREHTLALGEARGAIRDLASDLAGVGEGLPPLKQKVQSLDSAVEAAKGDVRLLADKLGDLEKVLSDKADRGTAPAQAVSADTGATGDLLGLVRALEDRVDGLQDALRDVGQSSGSAPTPTKGDGLGAKAQDLADFVQQAISGLGERLDGLTGQVDSVMGAAKRAADVGRGNTTAIEGLEGRLGDALRRIEEKADKSQIDAVLASLSQPDVSPEDLAGEADALADGEALGKLMEHGKRLRGLEAATAALRETLSAMQGADAVKPSDVENLGARLDALKQAVDPVQEILDRLSELEAHVAGAARGIGGLQRSAASKVDLDALKAPLAGSLEKIAELEREVARLSSHTRRLDGTTVRLGADFRRLDMTKADKAEGDQAAALAKAPSVRSPPSASVIDHVEVGASPDELLRTAADAGAWADAIAELREEVDRLGGNVHARIEGLENGALHTAYALLLMNLGQRANDHTSRPVTRPGTSYSRPGTSYSARDSDPMTQAGFQFATSGLPAEGSDAGARDRSADAAADGPVEGSTEDQPKGASEAPPRDAAVSEVGAARDTARPAGRSAAGRARAGRGEPDPMEMLLDMLDRGLINEKSDKDALARLAEWVDHKDRMGDASNGELTKGVSGADGADGTDWSDVIRKLQEDIARLRKQVRGLQQGAKNAVQQPSSSPFKFGEGDNAILSSKPLLGLRCMSCDRPLDEVQDTPGTYMPGQMFPARTKELNKAQGLNEAHDPHALHPKPQSQSSSRLVAASSRKSVPNGTPSRLTPSPGRRPPADRTPSHLVGPTLPPGGWRGNQDYFVEEGGPGELPAMGRVTPSRHTRSQILPGTASRGNLR